MTAGLALTNSVQISPDWTATKLVRPKGLASVSLALGQPAPSFTARNQHGELVTVSGLRGAPAVIIFYPWAFSSICRGELAADP